MPLTKLNATFGLTGALPAVSGASLTGVSAGKVLQVVTATDSTSRTTTSTSFVTGSNTLSVNITPASSSNKVFIQVCSGGDNNTNASTSHYTIYRDSTDLGQSSEGLTGLQRNQGNKFPMSMSVLDSPSTTSQITYQVYFRAGSATASLTNFSCKSTITAFEIEG
tara:strand:+ start:132 stop:626 length:495 start_codon:yes stop_codon:yes gene_type:complete